MTQAELNQYLRTEAARMEQAAQVLRDFYLAQAAVFQQEAELKRDAALTPPEGCWQCSHCSGWIAPECRVVGTTHEDHVVRGTTVLCPACANFFLRGHLLHGLSVYLDEDDVQAALVRLNTDEAQLEEAP